MISLKILFWNLAKNSIEISLSQCIIENSIDIAILTEFDGIDFEKLQNTLGEGYVHVIGYYQSGLITLIARKSLVVSVFREQDRYVLYKVETNDCSYIIAGIHLHDRRSRDALVRMAKIGRLVNDIKNLEISYQCKNTIIIGDFNANPYDDELLAMSAFNSVLFKDEILKSETRTVDGISYRRFYNPILHFISEDTKMYGSYYYSEGSCTPIWHCLDQVLVSKALANNVAKMEYLKSIEGKPLISKVKPNVTISDHLPLVVTITE